MGTIWQFCLKKFCQQNREPTTHNVNAHDQQCLAIHVLIFLFFLNFAFGYLVTVYDTQPKSQGLPVS